MHRKVVIMGCGWRFLSGWSVTLRLYMEVALALKVSLLVVFWR